MEKQKRWQFVLILAVILLTVYNILPTVFFYTKPLHQSIDEKRAQTVAVSIAERVNALEGEADAWVASYCRLLNLKPLSIHLDAEQPAFIKVSFKNATDANLFRLHLPRAGALIPFVPAQLSVYDSKLENADKTVVIQRRIPIHFSSDKLSDFFQYSQKRDSEGHITDLYRALVNDRALQLGVSLGGVNENAQYVQAVKNRASDPQTQDLIVLLAQNILSFVN